MQFEVPIAEWAGAANYSGNNDVDYVSHDGTNIVYGTAGAAIPTTTPSGILEEYEITSAFSNVQPTDSFVMEFNLYGTWLPGGDILIEPLQFNGTNVYGADVRANSSNRIYITRGKYRRNVGGTDAWSGVPAGSMWRVKRTRGGVATGFGLATSTQPGLISRVAAPTDITATPTGAATTTVTLSIKAIGHMVQIGVQQAAASSATVNHITVPAGTIPEAYRPNALIRVPCVVIDLGSSISGYAIIGADGSIEFRRYDSANFTNTVSAGAATSGQRNILTYFVT